MPGNRDAAADLTIDLAEFLGTLPAELRRLAERRRAGDSVSQIARDLGAPRTTVSSWVRRLRERCERAGLRDYL